MLQENLLNLYIYWMQLFLCLIAVLAVAVSKDAWYGWVSSWLLGQSNTPRHLTPLGTRADNKVVIGHNVGYDCKRVRDMSTISSYQRASS
jgi:hypothetical protein